MPPDVPELLGRVRELTTAFKAGNQASIRAFRDLATLLFGLTVGADGSVPRLTYGATRDKATLGGMGGPQDPLRLRDGNYLKVVSFLYLANTENGTRLKVRDSSYQYQLDTDGHDWIFRYDYERDASDRHPPAHVHVRGQLSAEVIGKDRPLERVHLPTTRVSFEAVLRLLAEQFEVPTATPSEIWRPVLAEAEQLFAAIANQPLSGPSE